MDSSLPWGGAFHAGPPSNLARLQLIRITPRLTDFSLRRWTLLAVALVAIAGTIYGATNGARRSIGPAETPHARAVAPPALPAPAEPASTVR